MSYWQDHAMKKEELHQKPQSSSINPDVQSLFHNPGETALSGGFSEAIQLYTALQQRNQQNGLGSDNIDSILHQLFVEASQSNKGKPPASKSFIASLPKLDSKSVSNLDCSICQDELQGQQAALKLPCHHCYHSDCILPWFNLHNTCPSCRIEFPTDDLEYEKAKRKAMEEKLKEEDSEEEWDPFYG